MHLKKYSYHIFALLLLCECRGRCTEQYSRQEEEGYYTKNDYTLGIIEAFEETITLLTSEEITNFRKKLADRICKWNASKSNIEKTPYELWHDFFTNEIAVNIVAKLKKAHDVTLLENYYTKLGNLFKTPTEENEKELITAAEKLQADGKLIEAFKTCIKEKYTNPKTIYLTKPILAYQEFLCFILGKNNPLSIAQLNAMHTNLIQWKKDGHPTGKELWKKIQSQYKALLKSSRLYQYPQNCKAIEQSLSIIDDQLAHDPCSLSYKAFLEVLPHGIAIVNKILFEVGLKEQDDVKKLKTYLGLVERIKPVIRQ